VNRYERIDPVVQQVVRKAEPLEWGFGMTTAGPLEPQRQLLDEAAEFGIRCGFTIPIHDARGPIAALTFASDGRRQSFERCTKEHKRVLQLMAMYFHAHAKYTIMTPRTLGGAFLSPREFECLEWAAQGKSAWETGQILKISRHTVAFHLGNVKTKLGVRTVVQAVARLTASRSTMRQSCDSDTLHSCGGRAGTLFHLQWIGDPTKRDET
jgi:DNA-binding CsgD family transcriptional regulator